MNFELLQAARSRWDEQQVIGRDVYREGRLSHIVGMVRQQDQVKLYVLEETGRVTEQENENAGARANEVLRSGASAAGTEQEERGPQRTTNRDILARAEERNYFDWVKAVIVGGTELAVESACSACFGISDNFGNWLALYEMMKAGWSLPENHPFWRRDWERLLLKEMVFGTRVEKLPDWNKTPVRVRHGEMHRRCLLGLPVLLTVGEQQEIPFTLDDGREGICYISAVYPIDVWAEHEKQFENPGYREIMSEEELLRHKEHILAGLEQDCPRGMCYLGVEYECTLDGSLTFYDRAFLDAEPKVHTGSVMIRGMVLRPDDPIGPHGCQKRGCAIQTPLPPDVRTLPAELFFYMELIPETEETVLENRGS